jgi:transcription initiation factor TFIIB
MELAAIWKQVDALVDRKDEIKLVVNNHVCTECDGVKVITPEGFPVCSSCGLVEDRFIDDSPEWTSGVSEDGRINDPSRCGNPNSNPELFSQSWGKGTVVATTSSSKYELKRMAKINFHMSMNHKDRSLFHAYKDIDEACYTLPDSILKDAKMMYKKFDDSKLTRGAVRTGIKGNCVLYACRLSKVPRTTKEIADMLVRVSESTTDGFWETNLGTWFKEVLTLEDIFWGKFTEIFLGSNFSWEKRRREAGTRLHFTTDTWFGWTNRAVPGWCIHTFFNRIHGFCVVYEHEVDHNRNGEGNQDLSWRDFVHLHLHLYILSTIFFILSPESCTGLDMFPPQTRARARARARVQARVHEFSFVRDSMMVQTLSSRTRDPKIR